TRKPALARYKSRSYSRMKLCFPGFLFHFPASSTGSSRRLQPRQYVVKELGYCSEVPRSSPSSFLLTSHMSYVTLLCTRHRRLGHWLIVRAKFFKELSI